MLNQRASLPAKRGTTLPREGWPSTALIYLRHRRVIAQIFIPGLDRPGQFERQRLALAVDRFARLHPHPAFGHAIFLDIAPHHALEPDADATPQPICIEKWRGRINRNPVWRTIISGRSIGGLVGRWCIIHPRQLPKDCGTGKPWRRNQNKIAPGSPRPTAASKRSVKSATISPSRSPSR